MKGTWSFTQTIGRISSVDYSGIPGKFILKMKPGVDLETLLRFTSVKVFNEKNEMFFNLMKLFSSKMNRICDAEKNEIEKTREIEINFPENFDVMQFEKMFFYHLHGPVVVGLTFPIK